MLCLCCFVEHCDVIEVKWKKLNWNRLKIGGVRGIILTSAWKGNSPAHNIKTTHQRVSLSDHHCYWIELQTNVLCYIDD